MSNSRIISTENRFICLYSFVKGVTAATWASALSWGGYFYFYERAKKRKSVAAGNITTGPVDHLLAGAEAGCIMVFLTNPLWLIKTRLQIQGKDPSSKKYTGTVDAVRTIVKEEGFKGFYKGFVPAILLTSHGAIQFTVYEYLKAQYASSSYQTSNTLSSSAATASTNSSVSASVSQPAQISLVIGGVSKVVAATLTYPYQVVKSRLQQRENMIMVEVVGRGNTAVMKYSGTLDCLQHIWM